MAHAVTVTVPGSSANLGPGFDCLGVALPLNLRVVVREQRGPLAVRVAGVGCDQVPQDATNLVVQTLCTAGARPASNLDVHIESTLPLGGGCGASAAAIVAGLAAARALAGDDVEPEALLAPAAAIDGHPDNVAASVLGGFTLAMGGPTLARRIEPPPGLAFVLVVPPERVATREARGVLPDQVERPDAVFNLQRVALLVDVLHAGRLEDLRSALADRLHEHERLLLAPSFARLRERADELGALGITLSGAGPSALVWCHGRDAAAVAERVRQVVPDGEVHALTPAVHGVTVERSRDAA